MQTLRSLAAALLLTWALLLPSLLLPSSAVAAEVLQVRTASLLLVGDSNRSYTVELACLNPRQDGGDQALIWLRRQLPRHSRVNLRPMGNHDGILLARVQKLGASEDLSSGLIAAGLASPPQDPPQGCS